MDSAMEITVDAVQDAAALPVQSGVVRAAAVSADLEDGDGYPTAPAAEPEADPVVGDARSSRCLRIEAAEP